jgi:hypothetical protein
MIDANEPLVHGAKDDWRFASPAVRIAVVIIFLVEERFAEPKFVEDYFVGVAFAMLLENAITDHLSRHLLIARQIIRIGKPTIIIDRGIDWQPMRQAQQVIVHAVPGSDVHKTCAGCILHEGIARKQLSGAVAKRMLIFDLAQVRAFEASNNFISVPAALFGYRWQEQGRDDVFLGANAHQ